MQASKYILIRLFFCWAIGLSAILSGCGEKTPEQIKAENQKMTNLAVRRARVLMFEDKTTDAIKMLEETYQKCGSSAELCEALAYAYAQNKQPASAGMFFENASEQKGGDAELQISAAKSYEQAKAYESAEKAYKKYLNSKPSDIVAWKALSQCQEKIEKYQDALNSMMSALKAAGRNPNTNEATKIGLLFVKTGNAIQARKWLEASFDATLPSNVETRKEILLGLITVYLAQKESALLEEAVAKLDKIAPNELDSKYPNLRAQLKAFRDSLNEALKAIEQKKKEEAQAKLEAEKKVKAEAEAKAKLEAEEKAKAQAEEKAKEEAKKAQEDKDVKESQKTDSTTVDNTNVPADNTTAPAQDSEPVADNESVIKESEIKDATNQEAQVSEYDMLIQKCYDCIANNDAVGAEKNAHLALAKDSTQETAWRALAKAYEISNKDNDSFLAATEAYKRNPDSIDATLFYLRNASRVLNNEKFLNQVYLAHEKFPNNPEIWVDLAKTYKLVGKKTNAIHFYKLFLTHTPKEHPLYEEMQKEYKEISEEK